MPQTHTAFFYETGDLFRFVAVQDYTRHQIKHADYPAVLPYSKSRNLYERDLSPEERVVRGTLVRGLEDVDIELLDTFEGDEYTREDISAYPLSPFIPLSSPASSAVVPLGTPPPLPPLDTLGAPVSAQTYVWSQPLSQLSPMIWEYADFVRDSAHKWVGPAASNNADFIEVDRRRAMGGNTANMEVTSIVVEKE